MSKDKKATQSRSKALAKVHKPQQIVAVPVREVRMPIALSVGFLFVVGFAIHLLTGHLPSAELLVIAGVFGAYMALNIGANDVANNVAPAVGAKALTITGALLLAAIFESAGALIAGGDVVKTIAKGIVDPDALADQQTFVVAMMAALLAGALWLNLATFVGAPVSTTHSIVGGVMGAGIAAAGIKAVSWGTMGKIAASWIISPVMGGAVAATFYALIYHLILNEKKTRLRNAIRWVPVFIAVMASAFAMYLMLKGLKNIVELDAVMVLGTGVAVLVIVPFLIRPLVRKRATKLKSKRSSAINKLFTMPLIGAAALLSFAHGANDVANAVGPLAAIVNTLEKAHTEEVVAVGIPLWVMLVGAVGISLGLLLYGAKLVKTVGAAITKLDQSRAYCVALSAAVTVILASWLGLPVSSTHIAVGAIFGIGLYREFANHYRRLKRAKAKKKKDKEYEHQVVRRKLVRRKYLFSIATAWIITVPCSCLLAMVMFFGLTHILF